jgi:SAM-dependent methyltransferase
VGRLALLVQPSVNRVYGRAAPALAAAELRVLGASEVEAVDIAGVPYVVFSGLSPEAVAGASCAYALFSVEGSADAVLRPVPLPPVDRFDDDLLTIQRYTGKTNEQFTRLLVNVALAAAGGGTRVLDPVAGRGTTLNAAVVRGLSAAGVERDGKAVEAYEAFFKTWLRDKRVKHRFEAGRIRRDGLVVGRRLDWTLADGPTVTMIHDDTRQAPLHLRKGSFDALVADLPYGVQHSASPGALVAEALEGWASLLRPGGGAALAFNLKTLPRPVLTAVVEAAGLAVLEADGFEHRVDHAIQRDVLLAVRDVR